MPIIITKAAQRLGARIGMADDDAALADIECGLHSGLPKCCVSFFVMVWRPLMDAGRQGHSIIDHYFYLLAATGAESVGYVVCPACFLRKRFVKKVKACNCHRQRTIRLDR